ncbi:MAG: aldo/keto reductase [Methylobacter sp.]|nr:MAG: aldo/keto reductase [Methylobacter sp.]
MNVQNEIQIGEIKVCRLGYGAMRLTGAGIWGYPSNKSEAISVLRKALELGVNFIDTADSYGPYCNEELICEALYPYPEHVLIATKGGLVRPGPSIWDRDARPERLRSACEASLRRLKLDCIGLYQLHAPDPNVPLRESIGALADLQKEGKIRHIGVSNVDVKQLLEVQELVDVASVQNRYNMLDRDSAEVLKICEHEGIAFIPWYPFSGGEHLNPNTVNNKLTQVKKIAKDLGATEAQVILAWCLCSSPVMLPIPGTSSLRHLEENVGALDLKLSAADLAVLNGNG